MAVQSLIREQQEISPWLNGKFVQNNFFSAHREVAFAFFTSSGLQILILVGRKFLDCFLTCRSCLHKLINFLNASGKIKRCDCLSSRNLTVQRTQPGPPNIFCQSQDEFITKESVFVHFGPITNEGQV